MTFFLSQLQKVCPVPYCMSVTSGMILTGYYLDLGVMQNPRAYGWVDNHTHSDLHLDLLSCWTYNTYYPYNTSVVFNCRIHSALYQILSFLYLLTALGNLKQQECGLIESGPFL